MGISSWFTRDEIEDMLPHRYRNLDFIPQLSVIIGTGPFEMFEALKKVLEEEL